MKKTKKTKKRQARLKLKPCPFCGDIYRGNCMTTVGVASRFDCLHCGALGPFPLPKFDQKKDQPQEYYDSLTINAWNRRTK